MIMKKFIAILLVAAFAVSFAACDSGKKPAEETTQAPSTTMPVMTTNYPLPTVTLSDDMVNLGNITVINQDTPFQLGALFLGTGNKVNSDTFYLGEEIKFTLYCDVPESEYSKVKVYCAPYQENLKVIPDDCVFVSDFAPAAEGEVNFVNSVSPEHGAGYYTILFAYEDTVAYRITVKLIAK